LNYRREIDGLRAIAVTSVILAHAGFSWIGGGFVGVDVFFVISGYLITGILLAELEQGRFSFAGFYERRARRILPALFCVLIGCLPFAGWFMLPDQLENFAESLLRVLVFISNFWFRSQTGYFAPSAEEMPLLHTWSLGVEEQFYLFFPLLALLLWRGGRWKRQRAGEVAKTTLGQALHAGKRRIGLFLAVIAGIALLSFAYAEHRSGRAYIFFTTSARIWELFLGALAAVYLLYRRKCEPKRGLAEAGSALGLLLILVACLYLTAEQPFPGRYALLPTLGALGVILFATPQTLTGRLLASRPLVGIGLVSYSAYLWHQPVFAFARLSDQTLPVSRLTPGVFALLCLLSLALAYLSWRFVEQPFRNRKFLRRSHIFLLSSGGGAIDSSYRMDNHMGARMARPVPARGVGSFDPT
jgi:peptidoglycan/LPS O-acetylase OafA/YrhL